MKQQVQLLVSGAVVVGLGLGLAALSPRTAYSEKMTVAECKIAGGEAWLVDRYHPDICPACAAYRACERGYDDYSEICPECYGACQKCQAQYVVAASCPECYGACQACQNKYLHYFESEADRHARCP